MLKLIEVNEENWLEIRRLSVSEAQKGFLDSPVGILARGYAYRHDRARVIGIEDDEKVGFVDTGYIDEEAPDCLNLMYHFSDHQPEFSDMLISDFSEPLFQTAFQTYFSELGITVRDWDGLFREMNDEGDNQAFVRTADDGSIIGFIQFKPIKFTSWFFEETCGFIREFWISNANRNAGHGSALLRLAESYFKEHGMYTSILTTDTAEHFYLKHGYRKAAGCKAKNEDEVFVKRLC